MAQVVANRLQKIGVEEQGEGQATPIVFLHGVGSDKSVWRPQLTHFGKTRRAIAFDYPGYGESDPVAEGTTRDDFARAIIAALDAMGVARAHICGLSLGGVVAIAVHEAAPDRCASLVLADTFAVHPEGSQIFDRSIQASSDLRAMAEARVDRLLAQPCDPQVRSEVVETMAQIDPAAYRIGARAVWLADQSDRVARITVPTLVLVGAQDGITPPQLSSLLAEQISGSSLELIEGAGHISNLEKPDKFNDAVARFLRRVETAGQ